MGYPKKTSPTIDKLAKEGVLFTQAISNGCATEASLPAILTSTYFSKYNDIPYLSDKRTTIAEVLKDSGYSTAAFHSNAWLSRNFHYDRGFDTFVDFLKGDPLISKEEMVDVKMDAEVRQSNFIRSLKNISKKNLDSNNYFYRLLRNLYRYYSYKISFPYVEGEIINKKAVEWLEKNSSNNFFLWMHYMDVHIPYNPPKECIKQFNKKNINDFKKVRLIESPHEKNSISKNDFEELVNLYDSSIYYVDQCIGKFLDHLKKAGAYNNTLIIITADHGEQFNDHGEFYHKPPKLYDELVHVPLIMLHTGDSFERGIINHQVELLDIGPTIIDYLENKSINNFQGKSLIPLIRDRTKEGSSGVISESEDDFCVSHISYRSEDWKYIIDMKKKVPELYDLHNDPGETTNVINEHKNIGENFELILTKHITNMSQEPISTVYIDEHIKNKLKMLGYF